MRISTLAVLEAVFLMLAPYTARAACAEPDLPAGWVWTYDGAIGDQAGRLTLTRKGNEISGLYFYAGQFRDIHFRGRVSDGRHMLLDELDGAGKVTAQFKAEFLERDPTGKLRGTLHCALVGGSWQKTGGAATVPVHFSMVNASAGTLANMYASAGAKDDGLVNRNALRFWKAVEQGDKATVASLIQYPMPVRIKAVAIPMRNRAEMVSRYDEIFSPAFRKAIAAGTPRHMFARAQGVMLGRGEVWFGANGKVIALNN